MRETATGFVQIPSAFSVFDVLLSGYVNGCKRACNGLKGLKIGGECIFFMFPALRQVEIKKRPDDFLFRPDVFGCFSVRFALLFHRVDNFAAFAVGVFGFFHRSAELRKFD